MPVVGDVGTRIEITVKSDGAVVDLSSASTLELIMLRPGGTTVTRAGTLSGDGTDGRFDAVLQAGDLSAQGLYILQARVVTPSGEWSSKPRDMHVARKVG